MLKNGAASVISSSDTVGGGGGGGRGGVHSRGRSFEGAFNKRGAFIQRITVCELIYNKV